MNDEEIKEYYAFNKRIGNTLPYSCQVREMIKEMTKACNHQECLYNIGNQIHKYYYRCCKCEIIKNDYKKNKKQIFENYLKNKKWVGV